MNNSQQLQDPTTQKFYEALTLALFLGMVIWLAWMCFYFQVPFVESIKMLIENKNLLIRPFFMMCHICGGLISACYFVYVVDTSGKEKHYRGARRED